jgi:membrane protease YdiL (CAAX protease family)
MLTNRRTIYVAAYLIVYTIAAKILISGFNESPNDILTVFAGLGIGFSLTAWYLTKDIRNRTRDKMSFPKEKWFIILLTAWIVLYITYGSGVIDRLLPESILKNQRLYSFVTLARKLVVFVIVPFFLYKTAGFSSKDFGLRPPARKVFSQKNIIIFLVLSILVIAFQYYLSNGGRNFRKEHFSLLQLITGFPLLFIWLFVEAGFVEEFFFRALLQTRLAVLLKSKTAGIVVSGLIFGLAHAPGLYLRGAGSEGINEQMPFIFFAAYTIVYMSIAGIFLGILYVKTKNLWLVIALHAMIDLVPNFSDFIHTWYVSF